MRGQGKFDFRTGGNNHGLRVFNGANGVAAAFDVLQRLGAARHERQVLAAEHQTAGAVGFNGFAPGNQRFGGVAGAPNVHIRNQAQAGGLLDGLVGGAVFAQADRIVGEHGNGGDFHQRGHAQGVAGVFAEHQEGGAEGAQAAVQRHAVDDGGHAELAHAVVDVVAAVLFGNGNAARPVGQVGRGKVGGAAHQLGQQAGQDFDAVLAGFAGGDFFGFGADGFQGSLNGGIEVFRQPAGHAALKLGGFGGISAAVFGKQGVPFGFERGAFGFGIPSVVDVLRDFKGAVLPAQMLARGGDFVRPQRRAVGFVAAFFVCRAFADQGFAADDRRLGGFGAGGCDGSLKGLGVVAVDIGHDVPAVGGEALGDVFAEPAVHFAVDGDIVVVVQHNQFAQAQRAGQRAGFVRDAFHQAAVAEKDVGVVIDDVQAVFIKLTGKDFFRQRHAHGVGNALPQRAGGGFDAVGVAVFGVAGGFAVQLAEVFQIVNG